MTPKTTLTITITLPCGCPSSFSTESVAGYESIYYFMKHATEVLIHNLDSYADNHKCEGGHAD